MRIAIRGGIATAMGSVALMIANLGRDVSISRVLGVSALSDMVFLALSLPVFLIMVATISFRSASLPFFERVRRASGPNHAASCVAHLLLLSFLSLASLAIVLGMAAGFTAERFATATFDARATSHILVMCLPMFVVSAFATMLEGPLQAQGRFLSPVLAKTLMPLGFACGTLLGAGNDPIMWALVGGHIGAVAQCLLTAVQVSRAGLSAPARLRVDHPELHIFRSQFGYLALGGAIAYLNPLINQWMATPLGTGAVSTLSYASRLSAGVASLAVSSLTPALLAQFSQIAVSGNRRELAASYRNSCLLVLAISVAGVLCTWALANPVVKMLYEGDSLDAEQSQAIVQYLRISILHIIPLAVGCCANAMLSATSQNRILVWAGALLVGVNVVGNLIFMNVYGLNGMAISTIVMYCCSTLLITVYLFRTGVLATRAG
jgi:putative peptidoglycan lipid II flippase